ncbi:MAG: hypothetical protein ABI620_08045 [Chloroflexota bacterium]
MAAQIEIVTAGGRTILLCRPPGAEAFDPDPAATGPRDVGLLSSDAASATDIGSALGALGTASIGVVGWAGGGLVALELAARRPDLIVRLAIAATAAPSNGPGDSEVLAFDPAAVRAKTLLVYGGDEPGAESAHGRWWQRHLPDARLEMTPDPGAILVRDRWARILSFLAPRTTR